MLPRDQVEALLEVNAQMIEVIEDNVTKRIPKRLSAAVVKRAKTVQDNVRLSFYEDLKRITDGKSQK